MGGRGEKAVDWRSGLGEWSFLTILMSLSALQMFLRDINVPQALGRIDVR